MDMRRMRTAVPLTGPEMWDCLDKLNTVEHGSTKDQAWDAFESVIADGWTVSWTTSGYTISKDSRAANSWDAWEERHASRN
jgi:hypothetical protein